jgi:hypothetical protein
MRTWIFAAAAACLLLVSAPADARRYSGHGDVTQFRGDRVCGFSLPAWPARRGARTFHVKQRSRDFRKPSHRAVAKRGAYVKRMPSGIQPASNRVAKIIAPRRGAGCRSGVGSLSCVVPPLAAKAREIVSACGSTVVSAVAGRPNKSNHPIGRAVDLVGNPKCIYAHLKGWPGGYSTDYGRVRHVHISYNPGGQEWGLRFAHGGHRHRQHHAPVYATALPHASW